MDDNGKLGRQKVVYKYKDFNIENHNITFDTDGEGVLISFPFRDGVPDDIKNKLNEIINQGISEWLLNDVVEGCMPTAENLLINARMQINFCYGKEPEYYIAVTITDLYPEIGMNIWIEQTYTIHSKKAKLRNDFIEYCRQELDKILFPV